VIKYTKKQQQALGRLCDKSIMYHHHFGGSRGGKTFLDVLFLVLRALKYPNTRHLICRASKASCVSSVWLHTLLTEILPHYKGLWVEDMSKRIIKFKNGSTIWAGGFDNTRHTDELLSKEWASILAVEISELPYGAYVKLKTRLNWNPDRSDIPLKLITECNPTTPSHWSNRHFIEYVEYETGDKLTAEEIAEMDWNTFSPEDNIENLNLRYVKGLRRLKGLNKKRFYDGVYAANFSGQIYSEFDRTVNVVFEPIEYVKNKKAWRCWDFGIFPSDTAIIDYQISPVPESDEFPLGVRIDVINEYVNNNMDWSHYADICDSREYNDVEDAGDPAGGTRD